ncbi:MAG: FadR/GntR family transcriptional regulator [Pseudomonadota bacterium]
MSEPKPARRSTRVYDEMLTRIAEGDWAVGDRLEPEARLAESFGVSRPVLREALARLRDAGLIVSRQGAGNTVAKRPEAAPAVPMVAPLASVEDMQRCFEMRLTVEPDAAFYAALRRGADDLAALEAASDALAAVNADAALGGQEDVAFHRAVSAASGNRFYLAIIEQIGDHILQGILVNRALKQGQGEARVRKVVDDHAAIVTAIRAGDAEGARAAMHAHLTNAKARIFEGRA